MDRFYYERTRSGAFRVYDRLRGSSDDRGDYPDTHIAHCRDRDDAERIVNALNAAGVNP